MSLKSALFAAVTAVVLIGVLGNPPISEAVNERSVRDAGGLAGRGVVGPYSWDLSGLPDDLGRPTVAGLVAFVVLVALLGGLAGRARPVAAFVGGWGAAVLAMALAGGVFALLTDDRFYGDPDGINVLDRVTVGMGRGGAPGVWTGWLIGLAVMLGSLGGKERQATPASAAASAPAWTPGPPPGAGGPAYPPAPVAPSWAPPAGALSPDPTPHVASSPFASREAPAPDPIDEPQGPGSASAPPGREAPLVGPPPQRPG